MKLSVLPERGISQKCQSYERQNMTEKLYLRENAGRQINVKLDF